MIVSDIARFLRRSLLYCTYSAGILRGKYNYIMFTSYSVQCTLVHSSLFALSWGNYSFFVGKHIVLPT